MAWKHWHVAALIAVGLVTMATNGDSQELSLKTEGKLILEISETGALRKVEIGGTSLLSADVGEFYPVSTCDVTKETQFVPVKGKTALEGGRAIVQQSTLPDMALETTARYDVFKGLVRVTLTVQDTSGADRGLLVRFALPIQAEGWQWWDDLETSRKIGEGKVYENSKGIREFAALPEWADKPALKMGSHAVNFCNVITGPVGLCYAVPLDQPRIFRTGYDANQKLFYIVYDVALAKETDPPSAARFTFYLYPCDPAWGMRSALDQYYRLFPEFFTKHVKKEGMWMAFSKLSDIDNVNEFRFAFQEGAPEPGYDDKLGVYSLTYFTHAGMFAHIPGYNPETDPEPSYDRQLAAMRETFRKRTGSAEIFDGSALYDAQGKLSIKRTAVYGHIIAQYNLDPALAYGKHMLEKIPKVFQSYREKKGGELDGFYYDGITTGINYRREHFKYANYPPVWDPVNKKPFLYNYFSSVEFADEAADRLHADGKITMMNGAMGSSFYTAPHLDVMGAETGLRIKRTSFNYVRTICRHKPFVTLLKGNFSKLTKDDFALFMKRCVAYGVFPGFFDWPPSGLGPGSRYWDHAEWYDRDRLNHRLYQALCRQIAAAGWEPLTLARSSNPEFTLERFGSLEKGEVFFTVLNDTSFSGETVISLPSAGLPKDWVVVDEVSRRRLDGRVEGGQLRMALTLGAESLAVLHVTSKQRLVASHADEILRNLDLRKQMAEIDKGRPERLVHWRGTRYGSYERARVDGRSCFKLSNDTDKAVKGAMQWVMLYQEQAEPLKLRLKLKCDNVKPGKGGRLLVDTVLCHVNMKTHFTERKREKYELDVGTHDWREKEIIIKLERPLRSIQLFVYLWKCSGTVCIDEISVTPVDKPDQEYVVDPKMEQWYENLSVNRAQEVDARFAEIGGDVRRLKEGQENDIAGQCISVLGKIASARQWIIGHELSSPARRTLRELDDTAQRLSLLCSTLLGISGPNIRAPVTAVPGEQIAIEVDVAGVRADQVEYKIDVPKGWGAKGTGEGKFAVTAPKDALGTTGRVRLTALVKPKADLVLPLEGTTQVRVVPALESKMRLTDVTASGEEFRFAVDVVNNDRTPSEVTLKTTLPEGWQAKSAEPKCTLPPKSRKTMTFRAIADKGAAPGRYEVRAELSSPKLAEACAFSETVFYLPGTLNRLENPGFEEGETGWSKSERGYVVDASQSHSGKQSIRLHNTSTSERSSASQTITLNQKTPCPIVVRGRARAERVSGHPGRTFSVYVDIYYTDGTPLYGQTIDWQTGTTGWQYGELTIEPAKPIRNVNVYCLLRRHSGTAWFDDLFVAEDPTRRGNIARQAKVSVDSCYGQYTAAPINDGVTRTEGLHWTKESWASAETEDAHWVELAFDKAMQMRKVLIHWSMDAGAPRTSKRIELQAWVDGKWQRVCEKRIDKAEPVTVVDFGKDISAQKLRLFQPKGCGIAGRPDLMWIREIEIYEK